MLEKLFIVFLIIYMIVCGYFIVIDIINKKSSKRKTQIEIGKSVNERFDRIEKALNRLESKLGDVQKTVQGTKCDIGNYRKDVKDMREKLTKDIDMYNTNIEKISKDADEIFGLLNKQPEEEKKGDNSPIWGILSGILSGVLSSALMNTSEKKNDSQNTEQTEQSKDDSVDEIIEKIKTGYEEALKEENKPEETQE